jgi:hypothetical protein
MSGAARTNQVTIGIRQLGVAIVASALAASIAGALAYGQLTAPRGQADPALTNQGPNPEVVIRPLNGGLRGMNFPD